MYGYIAIDKPEIKFKDYDTYRSYYCGLCACLGKKYGLSGKMTLGNDMTFLVLLLSGLYDTETTSAVRRCIAHPLKKHAERNNEFTRYAADMNMLLFYYKCIDDWKDERKFSRRMYAALISGRVRRIEKEHEEKALKIKMLLEKLSQIENENSEKQGSNAKKKRVHTEEAHGDADSQKCASQTTGTDVDSAAGVFGEILAEVFAYRKDVWESTLREVGFYIGKFIYIADAYEDIEDDIERETFNPLKNLYANEETHSFDETCGAILKIMMADCTQAFERLPVVDNIEILRNILYAGVWVKFDATVQKRKEMKYDRPL